jgi:quercetin dioxygenase-like cupin family protein
MSTVLNIHRDGKTFVMGDTQSKVLVSPATGSRHVTFNYIRYGPNAEFPQHVHEQSEDVFLILEGTGWLREGDKRTPIGPGDVVFIPPGELHGTIAGPDGMVVVSCQGPPDAKLYTGERDSSRRAAAGKTP